MRGVKWLGIAVFVCILLLGILHMFGFDMEVELEESFRGGYHRRRSGRRPGLGHRHDGWGRRHDGWGRRHDGWGQYRGWWPGTWWGAGTPIVAYPRRCPSGCMNIGRGVWGCPIPGNSPRDCQFASDCQFCDRGWFW